MKKTLITILLLNIMVLNFNNAFAETRYVKKGKFIEIQTVHYEDKLGQVEVIVNTQGFNATMLNSALISVNKEIAYWTNFDMEKYRQEKLAPLNARKAELLGAKAEIEK